MQPIIWQQFGIRKDPYDTLPLVEGGDLPIEKAFVGRGKERGILNDLFESSDNVSLALCGGVGVGKTSLINFHKFIWKYHRQKLVFSSRKEIEASEELLDKKNFLIEIIGSVIREINLIDPILLRDPFLKKLQQLVDLSQTLSITGGFSVPIPMVAASLSGQKISRMPLQLSMASLEGYFKDLISFLRMHEIKGLRYSGLLIHVNNFDIVFRKSNLKKNVVQFFHEIRDLLQTPHTYFVFLGPPNFYSEILSPEQRLKAVFRSPLRILPLSKTEIVEALHERIKLLKSEGVAEALHPVEDGIIGRLYDLYNGDIRSIMASLRDIIGQCSDHVTRALTTDEAMVLLGRERWGRIQKQKFTDEQLKILEFLANAPSPIAKKQIVKVFNKALSNVSTYYFKPLKDFGIIEEKERRGKIKLWGLTEEYIPLKWILESKIKLAEKAAAQAEQLAFF